MNTLMRRDEFRVKATKFLKAVQTTAFARLDVFYEPASIILANVSPGAGEILVGYCESPFSDQMILMIQMGTWNPLFLEVPRDFLGLVLQEVTE